MRVRKHIRDLGDQGIEDSEVPHMVGHKLRIDEERRVPITIAILLHALSSNKYKLLRNVIPIKNPSHLNPFIKMIIDIVLD